MNPVEQFKVWIIAEFPTSHIRTDIGGPDDMDYIHVFGVPDDDMIRFKQFRETKLYGFIDSAQIPYICVLPFSLSNTQKYYPEIWQEMLAARKTADEPVAARNGGN